MTILEKKTPTQMMREPLAHMVEWIVGVVGAVAAAVGLWMYHGPADGMLRLFGLEWDVSTLAEAWPFSLIVVGGLMLASAFAIFSSREYTHHGEGDVRVWTGSILSVLALAGAVTYLLIWLL